MLKALDSYGNEIVAYNCSEQELKFIRQTPHYCPECRQEVVLKAGTVVIPHFAHVKKASCSNQGESQDHLEGKLQLYHWCLRQGLYAKLEHYIPSIEQRVDVIVKIANKWIAIEYQCSPISTKELLKRTTGIASKGIFPLWIFGSKYFDVKQKDLFWNTTLRAGVFYNQFSKQDQLIFYDPKCHCLTIASHLFNAKGKATAHLWRTSLNAITWDDLFKRTHFLKYRLYHKWLLEKKYFRSSPKRYPSKPDKKFMRQLYALNLHPQNLPSCIYLPVKNSNRLLIPDYIWQTQVVLYLNQFNIGERIEWSNFYRITQPYFTNTVNSIYPRSTVHPLRNYLDILSRLGYLKLCNATIYTKQKKVKFHRILDDALESDQRILKKLLKL